jgi:AcrR family transcriptional regulator
VTTDRPLRADARRNRDALVATAREVVDAGTFFDVRFDDFAALAGVGTGTLYRHFPTRQALAEAVYREEIHRLGERAGELRQDLPGFEALSTFLHEMVDLVRDHRGLARTLATLLGPGAAPGQLAEGTRVLEQAVGGLVDAAVQDGTARPDVEAAHVVGALVTALHGIGAVHDRPRSEPEARTLLTLLLDGLRRT